MRIDPTKGLSSLGGRDSVPGSVRRLALALAMVFASATSLHAAPGSFTTPAAFAAAVPGAITSVDFDSLAGGTPLSGTTQTAPGAGAGIVLPGPVDDVLDPSGPALALQVVSDGGDNPTTSGAHSLGADDPGNFRTITAGTPLAFGFTSPVLAFGLTIITPEEPDGALFDGDIRLSIPGQASASLSLSDAQLLGTFGGREYRAYFLGVVGSSFFTDATLDFGAETPASGFFFNVDDLLVPLPEPTGMGALFAGSTLLVLLQRGRSARKGSSCR